MTPCIAAFLASLVVWFFVAVAWVRRGYDEHTAGNIERDARG